VIEFAPCSQGELAEARRLAQVDARERGAVGRVGRSGRLLARIPTRAFFNAIDREGEHANGKLPWDDPGYREHVLRNYPELKVDREKTAHAVAPLRVSGLGRRTRWGRVTMHKVY
jgi:hypothetical protein